MNFLSARQPGSGYFSNFNIFSPLMSSAVLTEQEVHCYHCGEICLNSKIRTEEKVFCCDGCKMVYNILNQSELCEYYNLNDNPGINQRVRVRHDKFAFLDDEKIQQELISFGDEKQVVIR